MQANRNDSLGEIMITINSTMSTKGTSFTELERRKQNLTFTILS